MFNVGLIIPIVEVGNFCILHPITKLFSPVWAPDTTHFTCLFLFLVLITFLKCTCWSPFSKICNGEDPQKSRVHSSLLSSSVFWTRVALFTLSNHFCLQNSWSLLVSTCFSFSKRWPRNSLMAVIWGNDKIYLIYSTTGMPFKALPRALLKLLSHYFFSFFFSLFSFYFFKCLFRVGRSGWFLLLQ